IRFNGESFQREALDPVSLLGPAEKAKLEPFYRVQPVNKARWLPNTIADSVGSHALVVSESSDGAQMAMWTVNLNSSTTSPVIVVPAGVAHLLANGARILVEKVKPAPGDTTNAEKTEKLGIWTVYDSATGKELFHKDVPVAKGRATQR